MITFRKNKKDKKETFNNDNNKTKENDSSKLDLSVEKLALSNTISLEALIEVLAKKGIIDKKEVLEEVSTKMDKAITHLVHEFERIKAGRATQHTLEPVMSLKIMFHKYIFFFP